MEAKEEFSLKNKIRFITATSLFDGHDASIHIMRRILQQEGAEVIHLGHNRSVKEIVDAAIQEDVQGIAVSSYQGGHNEFFTYMIDLLKEQNADHIRVYAGGGGVIVSEEIKELQNKGVSKIFTPEDGQKLGLVGMIRYMLKECDELPRATLVNVPDKYSVENISDIGKVISSLENDDEDYSDNRLELIQSIEDRVKALTSNPLILGFTGTGGAGKSSLVDEFLLRYLEKFPTKNIAVLSVDPTRRKTGGALLGDRIRMNSASNDRVYVRSMATRRSNLATSKFVTDSLNAIKAANFDLIILETAGIGQSDSEVTEISDVSIYVMTPEFGAPSQLEKIDMLDFADIVVINKFDKNGALDGLREVRKTFQRNRNLFDQQPEDMPVFGTCAHRFNDLGTNRFFNHLFSEINRRFESQNWEFTPLPEGEPNVTTLIPFQRGRYLSEIVSSIHKYHQTTTDDMSKSKKAESVLRALDALGIDPENYSGDNETINELLDLYEATYKGISDYSKSILKTYPDQYDKYQKETISYTVRNKEIKVDNYTESLSHLKIPKVVIPNLSTWDQQIKFTRKENTPGKFPYTAGVFEFKRKGEDPTRMFAGEGNAEQTNQRFHYVSKGQKAARLSTAFDSVTLYGSDPAKRMDIYGKIGNSGVSICSLDDAKRLYSGFDLCAPTTSVSMTINGPASTILAFFLNTAIDAECEKRLKENSKWEETQTKIDNWFKDKNLQKPTYRDNLPENHNGAGLGFLGLSADKVMELEEYNQIKAEVLSSVRGTVQADILKEDQAQNTCIFSTEFAMRLMGDVQEFFIDHNIRNFYSVSISGYHIAEAGATPVSQLAFTLANGFTLLEYYRSRGMDINKFAPNFSFFFSNGLDPEYAVIGRVARRIWAIALKELYGADDRSQKLKYHIQTSGRSLHAQEINFNDIRTTLQAFYAIADNCNSLHTNAYDEAITTPTEESVRRAIAIQLIINNEMGLIKNENPTQGSYFLENLTDTVEEAILNEFMAIDSRGGVLGAMETMYQRSKIQEESMHYEHLKHSGDLTIIGVNSFINPKGSEIQEVELIRSTDESKDSQIEQVEHLHQSFKSEQDEAICKIKDVSRSDGNIFNELMEAVKVCSLGQITTALYEVGGQYRRNM
ncbi:MAG: methylmalonyl-CoA mutase [Planctomycetota bacterium]|nr:MAG: methylmalonyl-CoA mutase [Planctomycetota bacterium]